MKKNISCFDDFNEFDGSGELDGDYNDYEDDLDEDDLEFGEGGEELEEDDEGE